MHLQVLRRSALGLLKGRLDFYRSLHVSYRTAFNPEIFELMQTRELGLNVCTRSPDEFSAVARRPFMGSADADFCFHHNELVDHCKSLPSFRCLETACYPQGNRSFAWAHACPA